MEIAISAGVTAWIGRPMGVVIKFSSSSDYISLEIGICFQHLLEIEDFRLAVLDGQHYDADRVLELSVLIEMIEYNLRIRIVLELNYDPHSLSV